MRLSVLLVAKGAVCVRPFGPRGFRRNRSKRHANHSFQNRWPNDRFEEKKALVKRGTLTKWVLFDLIGFLPIDAT